MFVGQYTYALDKFLVQVGRYSNVISLNQLDRMSVTRDDNDCMDWISDTMVCLMFNHSEAIYLQAEAVFLYILSSIKFLEFLCHER